MNSSNVAVVHMGFNNKERKRELQNYFSCQSTRRRLIPIQCSAGARNGLLKTSQEGSQLSVTYSLRNLDNVKKDIQHTNQKKVLAQLKIIKSFRSVLFSFDLIPCQVN